MAFAPHSCETMLTYIILFFTISIEAKMQFLLTDGPIEMIGHRIYKKELLTDKFQSPKELAYDSTSRNLYFMYMDDVIQNSGRAYYNVVTKQAMKIKGIERNKATAVDAATSDVYFGSDDGLYKYDPISNEAFNIGLYNVNIMKIVVRNNEMYLIDANNHMVYNVLNEGKMAVKAVDLKTVMQFDVDNARNLHIVTMCGVYCAAGGHEIIKNKDINTVYHFIVDGQKTFGVTENGIYDIDCRNGTANKVANLDFFPTSFIFGDNGDIFYSIDDNIYRLRPIQSYFVYNIRKKTYE